MTNIDEIIAELAAIDAESLENQQRIPTIDVRSKTGEVVISGNKSGLQHLALQLLRISNSSVVGAHYHLDEASIADVAESNVIFTLDDFHTDVS
jgi:uncharacterized protein (DUF885 family)